MKKYYENTDDIRVIVSHVKSKMLERYGVPSREELFDFFSKLKNFGYEPLSVILALSGNKIDWDKVWYELETQIQVKHEMGFGLNDTNLKYDRHWFSVFKSEKTDLFYYNRFIKKKAEDLSSNVLYTLEQDTEQILNLCGSPKRTEDFDIRGLVFGFVQAGKTLNYTSVANAAMDAGYDMVVILSGATNILRVQTQERIVKDLIGFDGRNVIGVGKIDHEASRRPISLTSIETDFKKSIASQNMGGASLENVKVPVLAVIKKEVYALKHLNAWLEGQNSTGQINKSILLIDDESDYASVNTREEDDPTAINRLIREMLNHFKVSTYLAITATPFANVLIDVDNENEDFGYDLFPKSFIWTLDKPSTYMGVDELVSNRFKDITLTHGQQRRDELHELSERILRFKKTSDFDKLPPFIDRGIEDFIYSTTKLRYEQNYTGDLSMMINISRFTRHHVRIAEFIYELISGCRAEIKNKSAENCMHPIIQSIYNQFISDNEFNISNMEFDNALEDVIMGIDIIDVHSESKRTIQFTGKGSINHIVVGGLSLSRGFTVEGLITSVFLRTTRTYDALMQMGRWFGHKKHLEKYISLYTTRTIRQRFESIQSATIDLIQQLKDMRDKGETPKDFGLAIQLDPEVAMQVVAANKRGSAEKLYVDLSLDGKTCETTRLWIEQVNSSCKNDILTRKFISKAFDSGQLVDDTMYIPGGDKSMGRLNCPKELLVDFITEFDIPHKKLSEINNKMPYKFLIDHINKHVNTFDLYLVNGSGDKVTLNDGKSTIKESLRLFKINYDYIQVSKNQLSSGPDLESTFLNEKCSSRIDSAKMRMSLDRPPLLLLYYVHARNDSPEKESIGQYWAWSLIIPGDKSKERKKLVYANSVLLKQLAEEEGYETEVDYLNNSEIAES